MMPPEEQRCDADSCFQHVHSRCKNIARLKNSEGRKLCSRHAGLWAIDRMLNRELTLISTPRRELFPGYWRERS